MSLEDRKELRVGFLLDPENQEGGMKRILDYFTGELGFYQCKFYDGSLPKAIVFKAKPSTVISIVVGYVPEDKDTITPRKTNGERIWYDLHMGINNGDERLLSEMTEEEVKKVPGLGTNQEDIDMLVLLYHLVKN